MASNQQQFDELLKLPPEERLRLARLLIDSTTGTKRTSSAADLLHENGDACPNPLLVLAGRYHGGPGDTAERAEEILEAEIEPTNGLGIH